MDEHTSIKGVELKAAMRQTLAGNAAPSKAVADMMGIAYPTLMAWADTSIDSHMPSYRLPTLLGLSSDLSVLRYLASLQGAVVVALPKASEVDHCKLPDVLREMSEWLRKHANASGDGTWTPAEATEYEAIAIRLQACIASQVLYAHRQADAPRVVGLARRPA